MNEETVDYRLAQIERKLDTLTDLFVQTQKQELRLSSMEEEIAELKKRQADKTNRWLGPLVSALVSGAVSFVLVKIGVR